MSGWRFNPRNTRADTEKDAYDGRREQEPSPRTGRSDGRQGSRRAYADSKSDDFLNYNSPLRQTAVTPPSRRKVYEEQPEDSGAKMREYTISELQRPTPSYLDRKREAMSQRNAPPEYSSLGRKPRGYRDELHSGSDSREKKSAVGKKAELPLDDIDAVMARYSSAKESNITDGNGVRASGSSSKDRVAELKKYAFEDDARKQKRPSDHRRYHSFDSDEDVGYHRRGLAHEHGASSPLWRSFDEEPAFGVGAHGSVDSPRTQPRQRHHSGDDDPYQPPVRRPWRDYVYNADSGPSSLPLSRDRYGDSAGLSSSPLNVNKKPSKPSPIAVAIARRIDNEANRANATGKDTKLGSSSRPMQKTDSPSNYRRSDSLSSKHSEPPNIPPPSYDILRERAVPVAPRPETACGNLEYMRPETACADLEYMRPDSAQSYCYKLPSGEVICISSPATVDLSKGIPPPPSYHRRTLDGIPISCASSLSDYGSLKSDRDFSTPSVSQTPQGQRSVSSFSDYGSGVSSPTYGDDPFGSNASTPTPGVTPVSLFRNDSHDKRSDSPTSPVTPSPLSREDSYGSGSSTPTSSKVKLDKNGKEVPAPIGRVQTPRQQSPDSSVGKSKMGDIKGDIQTPGSSIQRNINSQDDSDDEIPAAQRYTGRIGPGVPVFPVKPRRRLSDEEDDSSEESSPYESPKGTVHDDENSASGGHSEEDNEQDPTQKRLVDILGSLGIGDHEGLKEFLQGPLFGKKRWQFDEDDKWGPDGRPDHRRYSESDDNDDGSGKGDDDREERGQSTKDGERKSDQSKPQKPRMSRSQSEATTSPSEGQPHEEGRRRSLFDDFRLKFGSFGSFKDADKKKKGKSKKGTLYFRDFDDLVNRANEIKKKLMSESEAAETEGEQKAETEGEQKAETESAKEETSEDSSKTTHICGKDCQYTCHHKCRQAVTLDCASVSQDGKNAERPSRSRKETSFKGTGQALILSPTTVLFTKEEPWSEQSETSSPPNLRSSDDHRVPANGQSSSTWVHQDDTDSGYHTGDSTLRGHGAAAEKSGPGERTLTREELRQKIDAFNDNQHGLLMTLEEETVTFQGFIRVYMNLMRPISMSLPARPPSLYDVLTHDDDPLNPEETLTTSFYLPKDTTKVIHITSETTAQEVIKALLHKFKITDNPRKFALYEKIEENGKKPCMRRLIDSEKPLPLCLSWTADGLNEHKFVLQENDTGEIMWDAFSLPELENFLCILDREEEEYVDQIKAKFHLLLIQMQQQMKELKKKEQESSAQATPNGHIVQHTDSNSHVTGSSSPTTISQNPGETTTFLGDKREPVFV